MNRIHVATSLIAAAVGGIGLTPAVAAAAAPAPQAAAVPATCTLRLVTTKAINLQHDVEGTDVVRAQLGNTIGRERPYTLGQRRNTLNDVEEIFSDKAEVVLQVEVFGGLWLTIDRRNLRCEDRTRDLVFATDDARYKARAILEVVG